MVAVKGTAGAIEKQELAHGKIAADKTVVMTMRGPKKLGVACKVELWSNSKTPWVPEWVELKEEKKNTKTGKDATEDKFFETNSNNKEVVTGTAVSFQSPAKKVCSTQ